MKATHLKPRASFGNPDSSARTSGRSSFDLAGLEDFLEENPGLQVDIVSERATQPEFRERILAEVVRI